MPSENSVRPAEVGAAATKEVVRLATRARRLMVFILDMNDRAKKDFLRMTMD